MIRFKIYRTVFTKQIAKIYTLGTNNHFGVNLKGKSTLK